MNNNNNIILQASGICKSFGGIRALVNVDLDLRMNETLAIVGDNGAGKSTLINIISGVLSKDAGDIFLGGQRVEINSPNDAKRLGIETVYQNLALVDKLNVPANIFLGREITKGGFLNDKWMYNESVKLLNRLGINIGNLNKDAKYFSGGQRQAVALGRSVYWGKKIVILDEPTAALGVRESKIALELISKLKDHGLSTIIISHNLQHVFSVVDRIMVLRGGKKVGVKNVHEVTANDIVKMITGADVLEKV